MRAIRSLFNSALALNFINLLYHRRMTVRKRKYHTLNLHESLAEKIEEVIESKKHDYASVSEFVKEAVRLYLKELGYLE